ncbi:ADP-ribosylglycohydrolase [Methanocalculus alkaliphilus]|uniref:ADP-ribosylglycohydrolase family protein n=1 Tax=Methanocalculus alkaliphilus TaxID=768730 RepID=UPI00209F2C0D|nr:ADP-ribosylglycohydrolase family protein [Methanocalculus alkaliphilus]MCP1715942.1 ADP-ribosylglycohydrolase [Methanocalculus alkaliphilus]
MLEQYRGCLLGAALGDALGMPNETAPSRLHAPLRGFRKAYKGHPNNALKPGQFTDDTQLMLIAGKLLGDREFSEGAYAARLKSCYEDGLLRFPDSALHAVCEHLRDRGWKEAAVHSATSGCVPLAIPFALAYTDIIECSERLVQACSVTHIHPGALAGAVTVGAMIRFTIAGDKDPLAKAAETALREDEVLGVRIQEALRLAEEGITIQGALDRLGNDSSVYQTVPLAFFLSARIPDPEKLLMIASQVGGNTDTISYICGAYAGARLGRSALPTDLLEMLESRDLIEGLATGLLRRTGYPIPGGVE